MKLKFFEIAVLAILFILIVANVVVRLKGVESFDKNVNTVEVKARENNNK